MQSPSDVELAKAWINGDKRAAKVLVDRYFDEVRAYCIRELGPEGWDVAQKTFLSLLESIKRFEGRSSFRTYLYLIARRRIYDHLRARYSGRGDFDPLTHSIEDAGCLSPSRAVDELSEYQRLARCVDQLSFQSKEVLDLYYWRELTAGQVAEILGIKEPTVRSRLHTARGQLRRAIAKQERRPALDDATLDARLSEVYRVTHDGPDRR